MTSEYTDAERALLGGLTETAEAGLLELMEEYEERNRVQLAELHRALDSATHLSLGPIWQARVELLNNWRALLESRMRMLDNLIVPPDAELVAAANAAIEEILESLRELGELGKRLQEQASDEALDIFTKMSEQQEVVRAGRTKRFAEYAAKQREF